MIETHVLTGTTDGSGDSTATTVRPVIGEVLYVEVDGAALTDSANLVLQPVVTKLAGSTGWASRSSTTPTSATRRLTGCTRVVSPRTTRART